MNIYVVTGGRLNLPQTKLSSKSSRSEQTFNNSENVLCMYSEMEMALNEPTWHRTFARGLLWRGYHNVDEMHYVILLIVTKQREELPEVMHIFQYMR